MPFYVIEAPHPEAQHKRAVKETLSTAPDSQQAFYWACPMGKHFALAVVEAASEGEALEIVPRFLRPNVQIRRVEQYTAKDVASVWQEDLA